MRVLVLTIVLALLGAFFVPQSAVANTIEVSMLTSKQQQTLRRARAFFKDESLVKIAFCESSLEHTESDGSVKRGVEDKRDTGLMQINTKYHAREAARLGLNLENERDNMRYALYLARTQGTQPWSASEPCWANVQLPS